MSLKKTFATFDISKMAAWISGGGANLHMRKMINGIYGIEANTCTITSISTSGSRNPL